MTTKPKGKHSRTMDMIFCPINGLVGIGYAILLIVILVQGKELGTLGVGIIVAVWCLYNFITSLMRLVGNKYDDKVES